MKHEMPVMTEEQRQSLIADCKAGIARIEKMLPCWAKTTYTLPYLQKQLQLKQIALASLEAEVGIGVRVMQKNERLKGFDFEGYENLPAGHHHFYTAPPVPVMQPVDLSACRTLWYEHDDLSAEIECIPVSDLKKAIRASGYWIKE